MVTLFEPADLRAEGDRLPGPCNWPWRFRRLTGFDATDVSLGGSDEPPPPGRKCLYPPPSRATTEPRAHEPTQRVSATVIPQKRQRSDHCYRGSGTLRPGHELNDHLAQTDHFGGDVAEAVTPSGERLSVRKISSGSPRVRRSPRVGWWPGRSGPPRNGVPVAVRCSSVARRWRPLVGPRQRCLRSGRSTRRRRVRRRGPLLPVLVAWRWRQPLD